MGRPEFLRNQPAPASDESALRRVGFPCRSSQEYLGYRLTLGIQHSHTHIERPLTSSRGWPPMDNMLSREGSVRREDELASSTTELGIEEFEKSCMPEEHPTQMERDKPNDGFPFTALEAIRQQQRQG